MSKRADAKRKWKKTKVKDKKSKTKQTPQRDPWAMLQSQLGLLSAPVQHEQVSMVGAVDPREITPETPEKLVADEPLETVSVSFEEKVTVSEQVFSEPENKKEEPEKKTTTFDLFEFGDFGECDIPRNAFGKPSKSEAASDQREFEETIADFSQNIAEEPVIAASEPEPEMVEKDLDPFASDELPTSLWQPRKPPSIAAPIADKPSLSLDSLRPSRSETVKPTTGLAVREPVRSEAKDEPVDTSSGKKRRERGKNRDAKSEDRKPSFGEMRDDSLAFPERKPPRDHREARAKADFGDFGRLDEEPFDEEPLGRGFRAERSEKDNFSRASDSHKRRDRRGSKPVRQEEPVSMEPDFDFGDNIDSGFGGFGADLNASDELAFDIDKLQRNEPTPEKADRFPQGRRGRKSSVKSEFPDARERDRNFRDADTQRDDIVADPRNDARGNNMRNNAGNEGRGRQRPQSHETQPAEVAPAPPQKIAVPSWDDAIGSIIEKNMQRHPQKGGSNDRKNGGSRGRRR